MSDAISQGNSYIYFTSNGGKGSPSELAAAVEKESSVTDVYFPEEGGGLFGSSGQGLIVLTGPEKLMALASAVQASGYNVGGISGGPSLFAPKVAGVGEKTD